MLSIAISDVCLIIVGYNATTVISIYYVSTSMYESSVSLV